MGSSKKLQDTLNWVLPQINFYPLVLGSSQQPFLGFCDAVAQVMMAPPFRHNWNRGSVNFITTAGTQTYKNLSAWVANTAYSLGQTIIDSNGNEQKVITAGTSQNPGPPSWSTGLFVNTTDGTVTWQNTGLVGAIQQVTDFSFIEKAMIQDVLNGSVWKELQPALDLSRDTATGCPKLVSAQSDDNAGNIAFRLMPPPAAAYPVSIQYQKLEVPFQSLGSTWSPIPDRLFYTYGFGVLALAYLYKGDGRFGWASGQFITRLLAYYEGLDQTQINVFMRNWQGTIAEVTKAAQAAQGTQARGQG